MKAASVVAVVVGAVAVALWLPRACPGPVGPSADSTRAADAAQRIDTVLVRDSAARVADSLTIAALRRRIAAVGRRSQPEPVQPPPEVAEASTGAWWQDQALTARAERDSIQLVADSALLGWADALAREKELAGFLRAAAFDLREAADSLGAKDRQLARANRQGVRLVAACGYGLKGGDCLAGLGLAVRLPWPLR